MSKLKFYHIIIKCKYHLKHAHTGCLSKRLHQYFSQNKLEYVLHQHESINKRDGHLLNVNSLHQKFKKLKLYYSYFKTC